MPVPTYEFDSFLLDIKNRLLRSHGEFVGLTPKAFHTLVVLVENRGRTVDKSELLRSVWPDTRTEESNLPHQILAIRKALGESPNGKQYIETVARRGYRFTADVREIPAGSLKENPLPECSVTATAAPVSNAPAGDFGPNICAEKATSTQTTLEPRAQQQSGSAQRESVGRGTPVTGWNFWAAAGLVIISIGFGLYLRGHALPNPPGSGKLMLAVLPFQNLSGDPAQDYFGDGLTEEMIAQLGQSNPDRLRVIARTSAMHYKGTNKTVAQIGHELGVDYVLESSLRREGDRVRITTQLVRVSDQSQVWAQSYERDSRVMLMLQKELAGDVAARIAQKLAPGGVARRSAAVLNPKAYDDYLKGRFFWNERTEQGHLKAIDYFEQAIAADPDYAQAYSGLADAYALLGSNPTTAITRPEAMARARAAALKALAIDDTLAEAHTSLAFIYWHYDWNWPAAEKEFQRALQLNPSYPTAHEWYAFYLVSQHQVDQALAEIRRAQQTDPLSLIINTDTAEILYYAQEYDASIEQARSVLELDPEFSLARQILAWSYLAKRQYEPAVQELNEGMHAGGAKFPLDATLAQTYAVMGEKAKAEDLLGQLNAESERQHVALLMMSIAGVQAALGENDRAFVSLERDFQQRDGGLTLLQFVPPLDSLHRDPRFENLVRRIGLPE